VAFALPKGGISDAISTPTATAVVRVAEREDVTDEQIAAGRDQLRTEMTNQRQERFFNAYMQKAKSGLRINVRQDMLARVTGGPAGPTPLPFGNQ
jgi:parvulin-like peptidyl-prolyl isomerase